MFVRSSPWWQDRTLAEPEWLRSVGGELQCAVLEREGRTRAYTLYRINSRFERGLQAGSVGVVEAVGELPEATGTIWRYLLDIDWLARVRAGLLPIDHPLLLLAAEPRRLGFSLRDGVRVRLLDVKAALSARSYQDRRSVVIAVIDEFCPWNAGRWRVVAPMAWTARTKLRSCVATSVHWARSILAALPGRSSYARCVLKRSSPARPQMPTQSSGQQAHPGVPRFFDSGWRAREVPEARTPSLTSVALWSKAVGSMPNPLWAIRMISVRSDGAL